MKKIKEYLIDPIIILCVILITLMFIGKCSNEKHIKNDAKDLINYKDTAAYYKTKTGKVVAYNKALILDLDDAKYLIDSLNGYIKDLKIKKPSTIVRTVTVLRIDSIPVPFNVQLPCDDFNLVTTIDSSWYKFNLRLTNKSLSILDMNIPNTQNIVIGTKKNGLFNRDEYVATVVNSNPYMTTTNIAAIDFKPKKKFYNKLWFRIVEVSAAFIIGGQVSK